MFSKLILTVGISGAGKSHWVAKYMQKTPQCLCVCDDQLREEMFGTAECDPTQTPLVHEEARRRVKERLEHPEAFGVSKYSLGPEIIVDAINVDVEEWRKYRLLNPSVMIAKVFDVDVDDAMDNQEHRDRKVPRDVVEQQYQTLQTNKHLLPLFFNFIF